MLNKAIEHGKERRKPYKGAKGVSSSCRNHGGCPHCENNRTHKNTKKLESAKHKEYEVKNNPFPANLETDCFLCNLSFSPRRSARA